MQNVVKFPMLQAEEQRKKGKTVKYTNTSNVNISKKYVILIIILYLLSVQKARRAKTNNNYRKN